MNSHREDAMWRAERSLLVLSSRLAFHETLHSGQNDLVAAAALLGSVRRADGEHVGHAQDVALIRNGNEVLLQPCSQVLLAFLELLGAEVLTGSRYKERPHLPLCIFISCPEKLHVSHRVTQDDPHGGASFLLEGHKDEAWRGGGLKRSCLDSITDCAIKW